LVWGANHRDGDWALTQGKWYSTTISAILDRGTTSNSIDKVRKVDKAVFPVELVINKMKKKLQTVRLVTTPPPWNLPNAQNSHLVQSITETPVFDCVQNIGPVN
jgi:hypothetical protein